MALRRTGQDRALDRAANREARRADQGRWTGATALARLAGHAARNRRLAGLPGRPPRSERKVSPPAADVSAVRLVWPGCPPMSRLSHVPRRLAARAEQPTRHARHRRACASPPPRPASATRAAPTCCYVAFDQGTAVAGVFTRSKCPSAPVDWCRANLGRRQGAGAGRQFRQRQCLHRQEGPRRRSS